jgi:bacteriorhodopsin
MDWKFVTKAIITVLATIFIAVDIAELYRAHYWGVSFIAVLAMLGWWLDLVKESLKRKADGKAGGEAR